VPLVAIDAIHQIAMADIHGQTAGLS